MNLERTRSQRGFIWSALYDKLHSSCEKAQFQKMTLAKTLPSADHVSKTHTILIVKIANVNKRLVKWHLRLWKLDPSRLKCHIFCLKYQPFSSISPQIVFSYRGSNGLGKGALPGSALRVWAGPAVRPLIFADRLRTWWGSGRSRLRRMVGRVPFGCKTLWFL